MPCGSSSPLAPAIHYHDIARRGDFDGLSLRVLGILERDQLVEILAGRYVSQRERLANQIFAWPTQTPYVHNEDVLEAALEQLRCQRRRAHLAELVQRCWLESHLFEFRELARSEQLIIARPCQRATSALANLLHVPTYVSRDGGGRRVPLCSCRSLL